MNISAFAKNAFRLVVGTCTLVAALALVAPKPASATDACIGDSNGGESGDCKFLKVYTATDGRIIIEYWGNQDYDFYQLRWSRTGIAEKQVKLSRSGSGGGSWALRNAWENTPYTFKIQACYSGVFGSDCTSWKDVTYTKWDRSFWR